VAEEKARGRADCHVGGPACLRRGDRGGIGATPARVRHVAGMPEIEGDSERCSARTYVIILSTRDDGTVVVSSLGSYADTIVKTEAGWLFEKRVMNADLGIFGRTS
jgi:hypothetical protein